MSDQDEAGRALEASGGARARLGADFTPRLISGLVMGAVAAACVFAGVIPFKILVVAIAVLLSWEWGRLVHGGDSAVVMAVHIGVVALATVLAASGYVGLGVVALSIGAILAMLLSLGTNSVLAAFGVFYTGLPAVALIWLRSDTWIGLLAVVLLVLVVIASDTGGFVAGRLIGGAKLWPRVSPKKTWSGFIAAIAASAVVGALFWFAMPVASALRLALVAAVLSCVAQAGDLFESAVKRRFGAKDASSLIPGHGGFMDRFDGLVAAAAAAALLGVVVNVHAPARALLLGY